MRWLADYRRDLERYREIAGRGALRQLLSQPVLWALLQYRIASGIYRSSLPRAVKQPLLVGCGIWRKTAELLLGIVLPREAVIGPGLYIGHFGGIFLHPHVVLGPNCSISQGVTIGVSGEGESRGVPVIGSDVYIGPHAVVAGRIAIGNGARISANSLVLSDIPAGGLARGVPAVVRVHNASTEGSAVSQDGSS